MIYDITDTKNFMEPYSSYSTNLQYGFVANIKTKNPQIQICKLPISYQSICGLVTLVLGTKISEGKYGELEVQFDHILGSKFLEVHFFSSRVVISGRFEISRDLSLTQTDELSIRYIPASTTIRKVTSLHFQTGKILLMGMDKDLNVVSGLLWKKTGNFMELPSLKKVAYNNQFIVRKDPLLNDSFYFQSHGPKAVTIQVIDSPRLEVKVSDKNGEVACKVVAESTIEGKSVVSEAWLSYQSMADPKTLVFVSKPAHYVQYVKQQTEMIPFFGDTTGNALVYTASVKKEVSGGVKNESLNARVLHNDKILFNIGGGRPQVVDPSKLSLNDKNNYEKNPGILWIDGNIYIENVGTGLDIIQCSPVDPILPSSSIKISCTFLYRLLYINIAPRTILLDAITKSSIIYLLFSTEDDKTAKNKDTTFVIVNMTDKKNIYTQSSTKTGQKLINAVLQATKSSIISYGYINLGLFGSKIYYLDYKIPSSTAKGDTPLVFKEAFTLTTAKYVNLDIKFGSNGSQSLFIISKRLFQAPHQEGQQFNEIKTVFHLKFNSTTPSLLKLEDNYPLSQNEDSSKQLEKPYFCVVNDHLFFAEGSISKPISVYTVKLDSTNESVFNYPVKEFRGVKAVQSVSCDPYNDLVHIVGITDDNIDTTGYVLLTLNIKMRDKGNQMVHSIRKIDLKTAPNIYAGYTDSNSQALVIFKEGNNYNLNTEGFLIQSQVPYISIDTKEAEIGGYSVEIEAHSDGVTQSKYQSIMQLRLKEFETGVSLTPLEMNSLPKLDNSLIKGGVLNFESLAIFDGVIDSVTLKSGAVPGGSSTMRRVNTLGDIKVSTGGSATFPNFQVLSQDGKFIFAYNSFNYYMKLGDETVFAGKDMSIRTASIFDVGLPLPMVVVVYRGKDGGINIGLFYPDGEGKDLKSYSFVDRKIDEQDKYSTLLESLSQITILRSGEPSSTLLTVVGVFNEPFPNISFLSFQLEIKSDSKDLTAISSYTSRLDSRVLSYSSVNAKGGVIVNSIILENSPSVRFSIFTSSKGQSGIIGERVVQEVNFNTGKFSGKVQNLTLTHSTKIQCSKPENIDANTNNDKQSMNCFVTNENYASYFLLLTLGNLEDFDKGGYNVIDPNTDILVSQVNNLPGYLAVSVKLRDHLAFVHLRKKVKGENVLSESSMIAVYSQRPKQLESIYGVVVKGSDLDLETDFGGKESGGAVSYDVGKGEEPNSYFLLVSSEKEVIKRYRFQPFQVAIGNIDGFKKGDSFTLNGLFGGKKGIQVLDKLVTIEENSGSSGSDSGGGSHSESSGDQDGGKESSSNWIYYIFGAIILILIIGLLIAGGVYFYLRYKNDDIDNLSMDTTNSTVESEIKIDFSSLLS